MTHDDVTFLFPGLDSEIWGIYMSGTISRMFGINNFNASFIIFKNGCGTLLHKMEFTKNRSKI